MAFIYIAEFQGLGAPAGNLMQATQWPPIVEQKVAIGVSSAQSNAFNANTRVIRINADAICSIAIGDNPTASSSTARMSSGQTEYFSVYPGQKVAAITNT